MINGTWYKTSVRVKRPPGCGLGQVGVRVGCTEEPTSDPHGAEKYGRPFLSKSLPNWGTYEELLNIAK